jgi:hypothetical protein
MKENLTVMLILLLNLAFPLPMMAMDGMPGMSGQAATTLQQASPQPLPQQPPLQSFPNQPAIGQGTWQSYPQAPVTGMGAMGCMGGMGGMGHMMGGGMNMSTSSMNHNMDQGLTMREVLYIMSMQDALQAITDLIQVQEKLMGSVTPAERESVRQELKRIKEKTRKIALDYRGVLSGQLRSE